MMRYVSRALLEIQRPERLRALSRLQADQWLSPDDLADRSRVRVTSVLRHACRNVPFYREFCREAGLDPDKISERDLPLFPLVNKKMLTAGGRDFHDPTAAPERFVPSSTGGSSGEPFRFFVDARTTDIRAASDLRARVWTGWRLGDKQAMLWGHLGDHKRSVSWRGRLTSQFVHRQRVLNAYGMGQTEVEAYHRSLTSFRPRLLIGYASSLAYLADFLKRKEAPFPPLAAIISSAESLTDEFRTSIEGYFKSPLFDRYGSRELAVIAQQCSPRSGLHIISDRVHVEILRPDGSPCGPGERGEVVATDLDNLVMPFIRYRTGDLAAFATGRCDCGRGFPLLERVEGRTSDLIVGQNGKVYSCPGPRLYGGDIPGIGQMQLVQERIEAIRVRVVPDARWTTDSAERLTAHLRGLLGEIEVEIVLEKAIPPSASGKYRFTISNVSPFRD